ncbi:hypothetical protein K491DRAFT_723246 [Lophiostoma macrostomum CBS 122681]|uniref:RBR-type E3 ubiquitin transferase n=1 Tax=Lophiostoma macrostomum CBS 122681 TaxID=1314788 RepID=A0A6A6SJT5_9PLEO|nr:hypothetical protein K491DRAFT_723246 [Lophiostoma macrostomum CBS 122681]
MATAGGAAYVTRGERNIKSIYPELTLDLRNPAAPAASIELLTAPARPLPVVFEPEEAVQRLSYLPPLLLDIVLAEGYPTKRPPILIISTTPQWLPDAVLRKLEKEGETLWEEYGGMQMLFAYISYLQEASESVFGIANQVTDGIVRLPMSMKDALVHVDKKLNKDIFEKGTFDCGICLEPKKGAVCHRMQRCNHVFCVPCLQDFYSNCVKEGDVNSVKCLSPDCGKSGDANVDRRTQERLISPKELLQIPLPLETVQRFVNIKRKKKMEADPSMVFCPRMWCQGAIRSERYPKVTDVSRLDESDDEYDEPSKQEQVEKKDADPDSNAKPPGTPHTDRLVICEDCNLAFCKVCLKAWHGDFIRCKDRERRELTEEEEASLRYILMNTSSCPTCNVPCQKAYGCNHMKCFQCKSHFCYLCGAWLDPGNPYKHFNDPKKKTCYQRLMDGAEGDMMNGEIQFAGRRAAEQQADFWEREVFRMQMEEFDTPTS